MHPPRPPKARVGPIANGFGLEVKRAGSKLRTLAGFAFSRRMNRLALTQELTEELLRKLPHAC